MKSYGILSTLESTIPESLKRDGFMVLDQVLTSEEVKDLCVRLDRVYEAQVGEVGEQVLEQTRERDLVRCPLAYDPVFLELATKKRVLDVIEGVLGKRFLLHLQNGIINRPEREHHQSSWHRDLPYQEWTSSKPLALGCLFCLEDFNQETGGTVVLPGSHLFETPPGEEYIRNHECQITACSGSAILFDAMVYHRAGHNKSKIVRRGVNHVYTTEILKQQIDLPRALEGKYDDDPFLRILLGYESQPAASVSDYRAARAKKVNLKV